MYGKNHYEVPVWERIPFGCFGVVSEPIWWFTPS